MKDESYWENEGWRMLCNQTINLCMRHSDPLLDAADTGKDDLGACIRQFIDDIVQALAERVKTDHSGLWQSTLSFFGDTQALQQSLSNDPVLQSAGSKNPASDGNAITPEQALRQKLRDYLNDSKRRYQPHRANLWPRINRISQSLFDAEQEQHRCMPEHFNAVCHYIRSHHPNDHNLPRTYDTVEAYFLEFCSDCQDRFIDHEFMSTEDLDLLPEIEADVLPLLEHCLQTLQQNQEQLYDTLNAVFQLDGVVPISQSAYRQASGLSRRQMEKQQHQALNLLRECLQTQLME